MTDDELDLLASAYVDGEATPDEVAQVERDPELLARVEAFRAVRADEPITPPPGLAETQLAAAMGAFDAQFATPGMVEAAAVVTDGPGDAADGQAARPTTEAPVVDLRDRAARRSAEAARVPAARSRRSMPAWLPAAAAVVVIGGGIVWAAGRTSGGDDDAETASFDVDAADEAGADGEAAEESEQAVMTESADAMAADGDDAAGTAAAVPESAESDDAMEEEAAEDEAMEDEDGSTGEGADRTDGAGPLPSAFTFEQVPTQDDVDALDLDAIGVEVDLTLSSCAAEVDAPSLGELTGFVPVEVEGVPGEVLVFDNPDGAEVRLLVDDACVPLDG